MNRRCMAFGLALLVGACSLRSLDDLSRNAASGTASGGAPLASAGAPASGGARAGSGSSGAGSAGESPVGGAGAPAAGGALSAEACEVVDATRCAGLAQTRVQRCTGARWVDAPDLACQAGTLCDGSVPAAERDRCAVPVPECVGQAPGAVVCIEKGDGFDKSVCGPDLVTATRVDACADLPSCVEGPDTGCAVCDSGAYRCMDDTLERCRDDGTGFTTLAECPPGMPCNADSGACTAALCEEGAFRCTASGDLERCDADPLRWTPVDSCGSEALCDASAGRCSDCISSISECQSGTSARDCVDGSWVPRTCASGKCGGQGACCVEEPTSTTCAGRCGTVDNNCGNPVDCAGCLADETCEPDGFCSCSGPPDCVYPDDCEVTVMNSCGSTYCPFIPDCD